MVNFDFAKHIDDYVHRIGRTARGDREGVAYSLFTPHESPGMARQLVKVLRESRQPVDSMLERYAHSNQPGNRSGQGTSTCASTWHFKCTFHTQQLMVWFWK